MYTGIYNYEVILICSLICICPYICHSLTKKDLNVYKLKVVEMFRHAYESYLTNAFPFDELKPITCEGVDTWGSFSLSLIDALDTLVIMKNYTEFKRAVNYLIKTADFNMNINVSVFETNIRVVGGLISAHLLSHKAGLNLEPGWPCSGPLLELAEAVARRLLPAFKTNTGMPYGTVNLRYGVPPGETPVTCTAGVATFIVEFGTLSRLTGDPVFENVARKALEALWEKRSHINLVGNHINIEDGKWTAVDSGIGGGIDSYFEYLVKGAILFQDPLLMYMFNEYYRAIDKYMQRDDWYFWVSMVTGQITMPLYQSLESFWPGLLTLVGKTEQAIKTLYNYHQVWKQYGFTPEFYDLPHSNVKREGYPLRPELIESVLYLYQATKDPYFLEIGIDILESIEHSSKTSCGYATVKDVVDHRIEDRMESFFLAETTKYLYLLFDTENFLHSNGSCGKILTTTGGDCVLGTGGYVFNTEAHPIDISAVYCCSAEHKEQDVLFKKFQKTLDLHSLLNINEKASFLEIFKKNLVGKKHSNMLGLLKKVMIAPDKNKEITVKEDFRKLTESVNGYSTYSTVSHFHDGNEDTCDKKKEYFLLGHQSLNFCLAKTKQHVKISKAIDTVDSVRNDKKILNHVMPNAKILRESDKGDISSEIMQEFETSQSRSNYSDISQQDLSINNNISNVVNNYTSQNQTILSTLQTSKINSTNVFQANTQNSSIPMFQTIPFRNNVQNVENNVKELFELGIFDNDYNILSCPAQPFSSRLNIMGQMFNTDS